MMNVLDANSIAAGYAELTSVWHTSVTPAAPETALATMLLDLHRANFDLWHKEDAARAVNAGSDAIADAKRAIDALNQTRNDLVERVDRYLLEQLAAVGLPAKDAALHTETPGMVLDRLSILALKMFHTAEEIERKDAPLGHAERNRERLAVLTAQRDDLTAALGQFWQDVVEGRRGFKLYRQMKMYNDPTLNPVLYGAGKDS